MTSSPPSRTAPSFDGWVELDADHLRHNALQIQQRVGARPVMAVIKANAYGGGLVEAARILEPLEAIRHFAVVKMQEAVLLRDAGVRKPILLMGPFDEHDLEEAITRDIQPMVHAPSGEALDRIAARIGRKVPLQICIDTGLGRLGFHHRREIAEIRELAARKSVLCQGLMTHLVKLPEINRLQLERLEAVSRDLAARRISHGARHVASSEDLFQGSEYYLDLVRPGLCIFGIYPTPAHRAQGALELRPAIRLKTRVISVKELRRGEAAGYRQAYVAQRDLWVATLPLGHADGLPRTAAERAQVRIGGLLYPLIGMIFANHCLVEIGAEKSVEIGDEVTFFDDLEGSRPEDVAVACGMSVYDLVMHLNPLMPRRITGDQGT